MLKEFLLMKKCLKPEWNGRTKEDIENLFKKRYQLINKQMI